MFGSTALCSKDLWAHDSDILMRSIVTEAFLELSFSVLSTTRIPGRSKHLKLAEVTKHEDRMKNKGQFTAGIVCVLKGMSCGFWRISEQKGTGTTHKGKHHKLWYFLLSKSDCISFSLWYPYCCLLSYLAFLVMPFLSWACSRFLETDFHISAYTH